MKDPNRTILFDLDGTLLDSIDLILGGFEHTARVHGIGVPSDHWKQGIGTPLAEQFRTAGVKELELETVIETYRRFNVDNHDAMAKSYPGVSEAVRELKTRARLAIVSSKRRAGIERGLRRLDLSDCFETIVGAEDVRNGKPHPEPVHTALGRLGVSTERTIFVGDSPHDMNAGRAAGVMTAAVLWGPFERSVLAETTPDRWLSSADELLSLHDVLRPS